MKNGRIYQNLSHLYLKKKIIFSNLIPDLDSAYKTELGIVFYGIFYFIFSPRSMSNNQD